MTSVRLSFALSLVVGMLACSSSQPNGSPVSPTAPSLVAGTRASDLTITSFSVIEFQYSPGGRWYYAPQVEVLETTGLASATVTNMSFTIPGLGPAPPYVTSKCVAPGQQLALLHEVYGDFEFTIDNPAVGRATPGSATVALTFVDAQGRGATIAATGPVVPGSLPSTYSNPPLSWSCSSAESAR